MLGPFENVVSGRRRSTKTGKGVTDIHVGFLRPVLAGAAGFSVVTWSKFMQIFGAPGKITTSI